ncbi:MAG: SUMF1/EgtB/PvdO family nonheme iron enzyme [Pseudomonadota bacterium]
MSSVRKTIILSILVIFGPRSFSPAWAEQEGDQIAEPYKPAVVQVSTQFESGEEVGFGFVIGERDNLLYVITANHVVRSRHSDINTANVSLRFYHDPGSRPVEAELLQARHERLDLALLRVPIPDRLNLYWQSLYDCRRFERGERTWFIGREGHWFVPTDNEAGSIYESEPDLDGYIEFGIPSAKPGTSGAPLITRGGVIGMITDDAGSNARAVAVRFIRKFVRENRVPWNVADCQGAATSPPPDNREPKPGTVFRNTLRDGSKGPEMVVIAKRSFRMGSPDDEKGRASVEGPQHQVTISKPFAMSRYEVTVDDFKQFVEATGYRTEAEQDAGCGTWEGDKWKKDTDRNWQKPGFNQTDRHPVVCVSWNDGRAYTAWLKSQTGKPVWLPSEAEWEYAARAGSIQSRYWGDNPDDACRYENVEDRTAKERLSRLLIHECSDSFVFTAPAGSFEPNDFRLNDMLGNVWEWAEDCWHENYEGAPTDGGSWASGSCELHVVRGGSWVFDPRMVRSAFRGVSMPDRRYGLVGFRLAQDL